MKLKNDLRTEDGWQLIEDRFDPEQLVTRGSNFLIGNGYLGYRGTFEGWEQDKYVACIVTDTYDLADGKWRELCNAPNGLFTVIKVDGERVTAEGGEVSDYQRTLHLADGVLSRRYHWRSGQRWQSETVGLELAAERFASYDNLHLIPLRYRLKVDRACQLELYTGIDGRVWNLNGDHFEHCEGEAQDGLLTMHVRTCEQGVALEVAEGLSFSGPTPEHEDISVDERRILRYYRFELQAGDELGFDKLVAVYTSNDVENPAARAVEAVKTGLEGGYDALKAANRANWQAFWERSDVQIDGDVEAQLALRFCLYHNRIATPAHSDHLPIGARGLSCQAYQGAAFWDQEIFNLPVFLFTAPEIAKNILRYRYKTLGGARRKAKQLGYEGAFYAWISGETGDELCPDFFFKEVLTGRPIHNHFNDWQIHVSPDIVYALWEYYQATEDWDFMVVYGAEIIFEVARFLASHAYYKEIKERYEFVRLLGPDEYHENVDNNAFTNYQAKFTLEKAVTIYWQMQLSHPRELAELRARIRLSEHEVTHWTKMAEQIYLPQPDAQSKLIAQFDGYFELEDTTPGELETRLQDPGEYWGWPIGVAVHTQVIKQADVIQLFCQHNIFSCEVMRANYDYYEPRTQHGSSLSPSAYAIIAKRMGYMPEAYDYFMKTSTVDLYSTAKATSGGTFIGGIHVAACGGAWQAAVKGFGGMESHREKLVFDPRLPKGWQRLAFKLAYHGGLLDVEITPAEITLSAPSDNPKPVTAEIYREPVTLEPGQQRSLPYSAAGNAVT